MTKAEKMVTKTFRLPRSTISRLKRLAERRGTTPSEVITQAVGAYKLLDSAEMETSDLMELVSARLKEALDSTLRARRRIEQDLQMLDSREEHSITGEESRSVPQS